jgi:hypothetical protein
MIDPTPCEAARTPCQPSLFSSDKSRNLAAVKLPNAANLKFDAAPEKTQLRAPPAGPLGNPSRRVE